MRWDPRRGNKEPQTSCRENVAGYRSGLRSPNASAGHECKNSWPRKAGRTSDVRSMSRSETEPAARTQAGSALRGLLGRLRGTLAAAALTRDVDVGAERHGEITERAGETAVRLIWIDGFTPATRRRLGRLLGGLLGSRIGLRRRAPDHFPGHHQTPP